MERPNGAKLSPSSSVEVPSSSKIRQRTNDVFGVQPCLWQVKVVTAILQGNKHVICTAGTGMGKTLTFWIPLLFRPGGIQVIVTPLNLLGKQNAMSLEKAGIRAIAISSETATPSNFQAIRAFKYRAIIVSPEQIMKPTGEFEKLLKCRIFVSQIISIVIDEAHCLTEWGNFRPEYRELGRLRYILPSSIPLLVTSATLTKHTFSDITSLLHIPSHHRTIIRCSSDRPNIKISVKKIKYSFNSFADLTFLIPVGFKVGDPPPPKFLIFFDNIADSVNAANVLCRRLPFALQDKIKWFNASMSTAFKEAELTNLVNGDCWGLCATTSFGMGMDVPDVELVVQWRATCTLPSLWQRFGRAVRDKALNGTALLFAEKEHFDEERTAKAAR
ncbi:P-loop containing nucleoside triphosphate hydrolase protein, partial [Boletus edulis]